MGNKQSLAKAVMITNNKIDPGQIRAARGTLTQTAAAAIIGKTLRTWQNWEAPIESAAHRDMDPALFELFLLKSSKL